MKKSLLALLFLSSFGLVACSNDSRASLHEKLEQQVKDEEKAFTLADQRARKDEISVNTYQAVLDAGAEEIKRSQNEREELDALNDERLALLNQEETIRKEIYTELDLEELKDVVSKLDGKAKTEGTALIAIIKARQQTFQTFSKTYRQAMDAEKKVLSHLTKKPDFVKIDESTADLNRLTRKATASLKKWNTLTVQYNQTKTRLYRLLDTSTQ
ncbi:lipoprotein [Exiguobacterium sp. BMC-KP]|uniref:YkyA family protein n=1 Tax=Exiguobacterium sp. BMC-KP TaxID=1684312 RepID=UPI0006AA562F|nr:YkyA family protein [Exiguobacterium sp. BMC-KP]KOP31055.1 lipoprotein [Exiguobacterium sp. BMC-KP]